MYDELSPITGRGRNRFGGWAATLVDALDTLWIMGMTDEFDEAAKAAETIDFSSSADHIVNIFETTIRYLGGFLAAYDLSNNINLLHKAIEVGEMLLIAFDTPNHFPITRWEWEKAAHGNRQTAPDFMLVSELGSLTLEFTRLSQLTGDPRWYDAVNRIMTLFDSQQSVTKLPGLWPVIVDPRHENLTADTYFTFGGMSDSLYEYLPKEYILLGGHVDMYQKMYEQAINAATETLFFRPMIPDEDDILISGDAFASEDGSKYALEPKGQHLGCFAGGMLALGSRLFSNENHMALGRKLTEGCMWAYKAMERGIMPEIAHFASCSSTSSCEWNETLWHSEVLARQGSDQALLTAEEVAQRKNLPKGYTDVSDARYILRPEAIESVFYMYRITGERKYQDAAWEMFRVIDMVSKTELANAAVIDITKPVSAGNALQMDSMESFWMAETLKYCYLIFSEPELISLDDYVLNTEAHPLKLPV